MDNMNISRQFYIKNSDINSKQFNLAYQLQFFRFAPHNRAKQSIISSFDRTS